MSDTLMLEDFRRVEVGMGVYYLSYDAGSFEITLEPHLSAGFTVGIYDKRDPLLSVQKRAVWKFNHPHNAPRERIQKELTDRAMQIAQYFYDYYVLRNKNAVAPYGSKRLPSEFKAPIT